MISKIKSLLLIGALLGFLGEVQAEQVADISRFIPDRHQVVQSIWGDFNRDGQKDVLIVSEDRTAPQTPRLFQLINGVSTQSPKVRQNAQLIPCSKCGGPSEEPTLRYIKETKKGFEVQIYWGGVKNGYLKTLYFDYQPKKNNWFVRATQTTRFDNDHQQDKQYAVTRSKRYSKTQQLKMSFEHVTQYE